VPTPPATRSCRATGCGRRWQVVNPSAEPRPGPSSHCHAHVGSSGRAPQTRAATAGAATSAVRAPTGLRTTAARRAPGANCPPVVDGPLAFPCAQGFGAHARGGRGGDVCHVTKLADEARSRSSRRCSSRARTSATSKTMVRGSVAVLSASRNEPAPATATPTSRTTSSREYPVCRGNAGNQRTQSTHVICANRSGGRG